MYATAHRVRAPSGATGINAFYHVHSEEESQTPGVDWERPDAGRVADASPGKLAATKIRVAPGGNSVMSYLDVAARDVTSVDRIRGALDSAEGSVEKEAEPLTWVSGGVGIRFGYQRGLAGSELEEYRALKDRVLEILEDPVPPEPWVGGPLLINVTVDSEGAVYSLGKDSIERLREKHGERWRPVRVSVAHEDRTDLERVWGDVVPHLLRLLTGLSAEQVALAGGVRLRNERTGQALYRWPEEAGPIPSAP